VINMPFITMLRVHGQAASPPPVDGGWAVQVPPTTLAALMVAASPVAHSRCGDLPAAPIQCLFMTLPAF